jgi:hypothetical protein
VILVTISRFDKILGYPYTQHPVLVVQSIFEMVINFIDTETRQHSGRKHRQEKTQEPIGTCKEKEASQPSSEPPGNINAFESEEFEGSLQSTVYVITLVFH